MNSDMIRTDCNPLPKGTVRLWVGVILICCIAIAVRGGDFLVFTNADLDDYIARWDRRDGLASAALSDYFCEYVLVRPEYFLETMASHRRVFDEWLSEVGNLSFVNEGGCLDRECMKTQMIDALSYLNLKGEGEQARVRLLSRLKEIHVREIQ